MKKIFTVITLLALAFSANATDYTKLNTSIDNVLYIEAKVQTGSSGVLNVYMKSKTETVGAVDFQFFLPEGFTLDSSNPTMAAGVAGTYSIYPNQSDGSIKNAISGMNWTASNEAKLIATIPVQVTAPMGTYRINAIQYHMVNKSAANIAIINNVYTEVTVQRAAVVEPMPDGYALEVIPFAPQTGENKIDFKFKATKAVRTIEFDLTLPKGLLMYNSEFGETAPVINTTTTTGTPTVTLTNVSDDRTSCHIALTGAAGLSKKYFNASEDYITCASLTTLVLADNQFSEDIPKATYGIEEGVQILKITNISMQDNEETTKYFTGNYQTSLFVGTPTETDPIVYGHYTTAGQAALKDASTNFASIDMSVAIIDAKEAAVAADLTGKLIYGPEKTSYNRSVTGYGTVCLSFELTSNDKVQYYTLKSGTSDKLIFEEAGTVAANTPALVKGNIVVSADGYNYADPAATLDGASANGLTMKGTYKKIKLEEGEGYYIADNKFWHDWATIAPFRGYLTGTISGSSKLSILIDDATGLHEITDQLSSEDIYNLQGIKLSKTQKGVNIIGGKKILVK